MNFKQFYLNEYFTADISYLKHYLNMTDDEKIQSLPYDFSYLWGMFARNNKISKVKFKSIVDDNIIEADQLEKKDPIIYKQFGTWLLKDVLPSYEKYGLDPHDLPTWFFLEYKEDIHNQWLIHFTDSPDNFAIAEKGFVFGTDDMTKLGLTTWTKIEAKKFGGYNFGYRAEDAFKNWDINGGRGKYGSSGVIFQNSGILCYHNGDEELQVLYMGKTAKYIIPFVYEDSKLVIKNYKTDRVIVSFNYNDTIGMVNWVKTNYQQYMNVLHKKI